MKSNYIVIAILLLIAIFSFEVGSMYLPLWAFSCIAGVSIIALVFIIARIHMKHMEHLEAQLNEVKEFIRLSSQETITQIDVKADQLSNKLTEKNNLLEKSLKEHSEHMTGCIHSGNDTILKSLEGTNEHIDNVGYQIKEQCTGLGTGNTTEIWGKSAGNAATQSKDYVVGNVILFIIKPLYYEISDIFQNGLIEGVGAQSAAEAFKIRFGRVKRYVLDNALAFIGENVWEFVKGFVSSLVEGIISLFVGIFKQIFKLIKEGIKVFVQAGKVLFGKQASQMTPAQKGDAIIKILGSSVIAICGIGIEAMLNKIGIGEPWSVILATMLSGIASSMFMLVLDKVDLFSVTAEKRRMRIEEIFDARIKDIQEATEAFDSAAIDTMRRQRLQFSAIEKQILGSIENNDTDGINSGLFELASFMQVDLGYRNRTEFVERFDDMEIAL